EFPYRVTFSKSLDIRVAHAFDHGCVWTTLILGRVSISVPRTHTFQNSPPGTNPVRQSGSGTGEKHRAFVNDAVISNYIRHSVDWVRGWPNRPNSCLMLQLL